MENIHSWDFILKLLDHHLFICPLQIDSQSQRKILDSEILSQI